MPPRLLTNAQEPTSREADRNPVAAFGLTITISIETVGLGLAADAG